MSSFKLFFLVVCAVATSAISGCCCFPGRKAPDPDPAPAPAASHRPANASATAPLELVGEYRPLHEPRITPSTLTVSPTGLASHGDFNPLQLSWTWIASSGPHQWTFGCEPPVELGEGETINGGSIVRQDGGNLIVSVVNSHPSIVNASRLSDLSGTFVPKNAAAVAQQGSGPTRVTVTPEWLRGSWTAPGTFTYDGCVYEVSMTITAASIIGHKVSHSTGRNTDTHQPCTTEVADYAHPLLRGIVENDTFAWMEYNDDDPDQDQVLTNDVGLRVEKVGGQILLSEVTDTYLYAYLKPGLWNRAP